MINFTKISTKIQKLMRPNNKQSSAHAHGNPPHCLLVGRANSSEKKSIVFCFPMSAFLLLDLVGFAHSPLSLIHRCRLYIRQKSNFPVNNKFGGNSANSNSLLCCWASETNIFCPKIKIFSKNRRLSKCIIIVILRGIP